MIFTRIAAVLAVAFLCGCASTHQAPTFDVPSTAPIEQAHKQIKHHLDSAREHTKQIESECPQAKAAIAALSADLDGALSELQTSEGARIQLDTQLKQQTAKANQLATDYDKAGATITSLEESRHGWVKRFWIASLIASLASLWIFRKPLLLLVGL